MRWWGEAPERPERISKEAGLPPLFRMQRRTARRAAALGVPSPNESYSTPLLFTLNRCHAQCPARRANWRCRRKSVESSYWFGRGFRSFGSIYHLSATTRNATPSEGNTPAAANTEIAVATTTSHQSFLTSHTSTLSPGCKISTLALPSARRANSFGSPTKGGNVP